MLTELLLALRILDLAFLGDALFLDFRGLDLWACEGISSLVVISDSF